MQKTLDWEKLSTALVRGAEKITSGGKHIKGVRMKRNYGGYDIDVGDIQAISPIRMQSQYSFCLYMRSGSIIPMVFDTLDEASTSRTNLISDWAEVKPPRMRVEK